MKSRILALAVAGVAAAAAIAGCAPVKTTQAGAVGVDRSQAMLVPSAEIDKAAAQQYSKTIAAAFALVMFTLPNSRLHEQEADRIGVELAARAGYDPRAAVAVWQKMAQTGGSSPPQILSTHPSPASRIKDLEVYAGKVMPLYEATARKRG